MERLAPVPIGVLHDNGCCRLSIELMRLCFQKHSFHRDLAVTRTRHGGFLSHNSRPRFRRTRRCSYLSALVVTCLHFKFLDSFQWRKNGHEGPAIGRGLHSAKGQRHGRATRPVGLHYAELIVGGYRAPGVKVARSRNLRPFNGRF